ncbi:hypothetical protein SEA_CECE_301 [Microbacterium phage Cece]|nr:hypothetical protein SEA_CECE_301 [Microbacterium phage Cece]
MTLFASRSNRDPNPWVCREHGGICAFPDRGAMGVREYAPRSNFEYPTVNPVNPILAAHRQDREASILYENLPVYPSEEQIVHASKVLRRLARMRERRG